MSALNLLFIVQFKNLCAQESPINNYHPIINSIHYKHNTQTRDEVILSDCQHAYLK